VNITGYSNHTVRLEDIFDGGDGTEVEPFGISNADQLNKIRRFRDKHFIQTADIDLDIDPYNVDDGWEPIKQFSGSFLGGSGTDQATNYTISGLTISVSSSDVGLFGRIESGAEIEHVTLMTPDITTTGSYVGALAGFNSGTIAYCAVIDGNITINADESEGAGIGGLVGSDFDGEIQNSYSRGVTINVNNNGGSIGGLVGEIKGTSSISYSYSSSSIDLGTGVSNEFAGGLVGRNWNENSITDSYFDYEVAGDDFVSGDDYAETTDNLKTTDIDSGIFENWDTPWTQVTSSEYPELLWTRQPN
ncbi:MAG: hypothetical protein ACQESP_10855, partial [Candidatus Muiribacteriota bacterium]